jgi:hypothetical protein
MPDLPIWPSGVARLSDGILEVTTGDGVRIAARDIETIDVGPPDEGRLSLALTWRAGPDTASTSLSVEPEHEQAVRQLVAAVEAERA